MKDEYPDEIGNRPEWNHYEQAMQPSLAHPFVNLHLPSGRRSLQWPKGWAGIVPES
jgi:hypothetical protein